MATKADTVLQSYLLQSLNMALGALDAGGKQATPIASILSFKRVASSSSLGFLVPTS